MKNPILKACWLVLTVALQKVSEIHVFVFKGSVNCFQKCNFSSDFCDFGLTVSDEEVGQRDNSDNSVYFLPIMMVAQIHICVRVNTTNRFPSMNNDK